MAVGHPQQLQAPTASPALGHQLLTRIYGKTAMALIRHGPHIQAGPQALQRPVPLVAGTQQKGTSLLGMGHPQEGGEGDQEALINRERSWRGEGHTDTL